MWTVEWALTMGAWIKQPMFRLEFLSSLASFSNEFKVNIYPTDREIKMSESVHIRKYCIDSYASKPPHP